jgi:NADPH2:quinone reductase
MHYIAHEPGGEPGVLRLEKTEIPQLGPRDVLIGVKFAGVNAPDLLQRAGKYPPPPGASPILGLEVSGEIVGRGPAVHEWNIGDLVCALVPGGGYAEYCRVDAGHCLPIPQGYHLAQAAALPENWFTVVDNLINRGRLRSGERVLIHGGAGGIGYTAIQLARESGATVYTTVSNETKGDFCRSLGATMTINYRTEDFVQRLEEATDGKGVDVILDIVGGDYFAKNLRLLALEGRLVQIAFMRGSVVREIDLMQMMVRRLTITGSTLRPRTIEQKAVLAQEVHKRIWPLLESGKIKVVIDRVLPMAKAAEAHRIVEEGKHLGKVLLRA